MSKYVQFFFFFFFKLASDLSYRMFSFVILSCQMPNYLVWNSFRAKKAIQTCPNSAWSSLITKLSCQNVMATQHQPFFNHVDFPNHMVDLFTKGIIATFKWLTVPNIVSFMQKKNYAVMLKWHGIFFADLVHELVSSDCVLLSSFLRCQAYKS